MTATHIEDQDLLSPQLTEDPHAYFERLRKDDPVHWSEAGKGWLLTRYADVSDGYVDPLLSSDRVLPLLAVVSAERRAVMAPMLNTISRWMVVTDPPVHTRLRQLANTAFRQQRVVAMGVWIGEIVDRLLDEFVASGNDDFLNGFAYPLPAIAISRMMGAPDEDRDKFQEWSDELALVAFGAGGEARADRHSRALEGVRELEDYLQGLIDKARRDPGDDMISVLVQGSPDEDHLTNDEIAALCALILFAGHETTTNLLCNAIVTLTRNPEQFALLKADPKLINSGVEEVLRYEGPIKVLTRWVLEDHERLGTKIKAGERILLVQQSANRDSDVFDAASTFDIQRATQPLHVGFGRGVHACLGAQLARLEARVALPKILDRLPGLAVTGDVTWKPSIASRSVAGLTISHDV